MKNIIQALDIMGISTPVWMGVIMLILAIIVGIYTFVKKVFLPWIKRMIKIQGDIMSIPEIRENSNKCDKVIMDEIKSISDNVAALTEGFARMQEEISHNTESQSLQCDALKMILAGELDRKYHRFIELGYVPDNEFDEYVHSFQSYSGLGGNGTGKEKYDYIMQHLDRRPT